MFSPSGESPFWKDVGAELTPGAPEVVSKVEGFFHQCIDDLASRLTGSNTEVRALRIFATLEGALILARAFDDISVYDKATVAIGLKHADHS